MNALGHRFTAGDRIRCDNDTVFRAADFQEYATKCGFRVTNSPPYTPSANGVVERHLRTLFDITRALLYHSKLPKIYWGLAIQHATTLRNLLPSKPLGGSSPHQLLFGEDFNLARLKPFGCASYVHVEANQRTKLDPRARRGLYVGVNIHSDTFAIFFPDTKTIKETKDVEFDPSNFPGHQGELKHSRIDTRQPFPLDDWLQAEGEMTTIDEQEMNTNEQQPTAIDPLQPPQMHPTTPTVEATEEIEEGIEVFHPQGIWDDSLDQFINNNDDNNNNIHHHPHKYNTRSRSIQPILLSATPSSLTEALHQPDNHEWIAATIKEITTLENNNTWTLVEQRELPDAVELLPSMLLLKRKTTLEGLEQAKARLVVLGNYQQQQRDTFAPVVSSPTLKVLYALAAAHDLEIEHVDIASAFTHATLADEEKVAIRFPQHLSTIIPHLTGKVALLQRALYGLRSSPAMWYKHLQAFLVEYGFEPCHLDACLFTLHSSEGDMYLTVHVDDMLLISKQQNLIDNFKTALRTRFDIHALGAVKEFLGVTVTRNRLQRSITLSQSKYVTKLLVDHNMTDCHPVSTPLPPITLLQPGLPFEQKLDPKATKRYYSLVGGLLYIATSTRPDISNAVRMLSKFVAQPMEKHWKAAKHLLRYLKGTADRGITFSRPPNFSTTDSNSLTLSAYTDATFADDEEYKSVSGSVFMLCGGPIHWRSKVQTLTSLSTAEAEYVALSDGTRDIVFLRDVLKVLHQPQLSPTIVHVDNTSTIYMANNAVISNRGKHFQTRLYFVREQIRDRAIALQHVATTDQLADLLTKCPQVAQHQRLVRLLFNEK